MKEGGSEYKKSGSATQQRTFLQTYAIETLGLGNNWQQGLINVMSKKGVPLAALPFREWTQGEMDLLYKH